MPDSFSIGHKLTTLVSRELAPVHAEAWAHEPVAGLALVIDVPEPGPVWRATGADC